MLIHQIPIRNPLRNYMYLLVCDQTKKAVAIDPLDHALCLKTASDLDIDIIYIANTHHHHDHIGGNQPVVEATGASLVAHVEASNSIPNVDIGLNAGSVLDFGNIQLQVMDTPGHTMSHICLYFEGTSSDQAALFCGDTLFNAGVGRCDLGGDPKVLYQTVSQQLYTLDDDVRVFPGHDYIENNLKFTLEYEPSNETAKVLLSRFKNELDSEKFVSTIGLEKEINTFFRLDSKVIRERLETDCDQSTFIALRKQRDVW